MLVLLNGPTAGTGYSQLNVSGEVESGSDRGLSRLTSLGFIPAVGEQFTIINSTVPIVGNFDGARRRQPVDHREYAIHHLLRRWGWQRCCPHGGGLGRAPTMRASSPTSGPEPGGAPVTITGGTGFTGAYRGRLRHNGRHRTRRGRRHHDHGQQPRRHGHRRRDRHHSGRPSPISAARKSVHLHRRRRARPSQASARPAVPKPGTSVTITGIGFTSAHCGRFRLPQRPPVLVVVNDTIITANSPAGAGIVDVTVITPAGTSPTSAADQFTYTVGARLRSRASARAAVRRPATPPWRSPAQGSTGTTEVDFATTPVTGSRILVVNDTTILVNTPPGSGVVDVTVTTPEGTSAISPADQFTFTVAAAPTVTGLSPPSGPEAGGTPAR